MKLKILLYALIVSAGLVSAPAAFAKSAGIGNWPVETDTDLIYHFWRTTCLHDPAQANCFGFKNLEKLAPAAETQARPAHHAAHRTVTRHR